MTLDEEIAAGLSTGDTKSVLLDLLGWDQPGISSFSVAVGDAEFTVRPIAQKRGLHALEVKGEALPSADVQHRIDAQVSGRAPERILVFTGSGRQVWRWPEPRRSGGTKLVPHESDLQKPNPGLVQRLAGARFTVAEEEELTLPAVKDRIRAQFSAERVTARFYERFQACHLDLQNAVEGVSDAQLQRWYASLLMNRLMFIYFFQRKGFLNDDRDYLRTCLTRVRSLRGPDHFYSFYRDLLLPMFHHGFGSHLHDYDDPEIAEILGDIPYVNGGIFEEHAIEAEHDIRVADAMFESIFDFFDGFTWHLDDRSRGDANAINPDVIGYIFERYINLTSTGKREGGAYYTKEDVTGYIVGVTLLPRLLERLVSSTEVNPFALVQANPTRYMFEALLHGRDGEGVWRPVPESVEEISSGDAGEWSGLDQIARDPTIQLAGESWIETIDRRNRVGGLLAAIEAGEVDTVDDLVSWNLDSRTLLADLIHELDSPEDIASAWKEITSTRVIDPTCGSGAFLFAALDVLDEAYAALLERARTHLRGDADAGPVQDIVDSADAHPNDSYYRRKHAALNNLYGLDIMHEAVETAKLRLFLAMASTLDARTEIEPLPDLDFNLRGGNLLVGFLDTDDARERVATASFDALAAVDEFMPKAEEVGRLRRQFVVAQESEAPEAVIEAKQRLRDGLGEVKVAADQAYAEGQGVDTNGLDFNEWYERNQPFHWLVEFPQVIEAGGFDVVIGNPPYVARNKVAYDVQGYATSDAADIFAPCVERSLGLVASKGRFGMILPISLQSSGRQEACRKVIARQPAMWLSTYSRNPSALFTAGLGVRNTILATGPNSEPVHTTETRRWIAEGREALFQTTHCTSSLPAMDRDHPWLPRTGDQEVADLLFKLKSEGGTLGESTVRDGAHRIGFKAFALYYLAIYLETPPVYEANGDVVKPPRDSALFFGSEEDRLLAFGLLSGKLALLWWMSTGDDFDVMAADLKSLPIALNQLEANRDALLEESEALAAELHSEDNLLFTPYKRRMTGAWDIRRVRGKTDRIDQLVLSTLGLSDYFPAVQRAIARFSKSTGERPGVERGTGWLKKVGS